MTFEKGSSKTREAARRGGKARAARYRAQRPMDPYTGTILDMMDTAGLTDPSWSSWRALWRSVYLLPMEEEDREIFTRHTELSTPPAAPVREAWVMCGRRAGKSRNAAVAALYSAISFDASTLAPGELATVPVIASDRDQARSVFGYIKGFLGLPEFLPWLVDRPLRDKIHLRNGVSIEISTASYRTIRGRTVIACVCDEIAFWQVDDLSASPDFEILAAIRPSMVTIPHSLLLVISSPHAAKGELHRIYEEHFGTDDGHILAWNADSISMNRTIPPDFIAREFERDAAVAASEYGSGGRCQFRLDVESFLDPTVIRDLIPPGIRELPPERGLTYKAFVDPSGGSQDSMTLAVAHAKGGEVFLDLVREVRPPFSPDAVTAEFAGVLARYGIRTVVGDRYGGEWPRERFRRHGIEYEPSELTKSAIYQEFLPVANARLVSLLDSPRLRTQLVSLERKISRSGKDSISHPPGGRDDVANAAAGAVVLAAPRVGTGQALIFGGEGSGWVGDRKVEAKRHSQKNWQYATGSSSIVKVGRYW